MRDIHCAACGDFIATLDDRLFPMPPESWCRACSMPAYHRLLQAEEPPPLAEAPPKRTPRATRGPPLGALAGSSPR